ncbi:MAG: glutamate--tRNA ligase, partial [Candidatus Bathyarchaeia archaeon]
ALIEERWPELMVEGRREERRGLPPLPNASKYREIRTRFAPNPDAPLHLGSARPSIISCEYAREYDGRFLLRFEDTSPSVKPPVPEVYDMITTDLEWLGAKPDETYYQSGRLELYYRWAREGITIGKLYVCTCDPRIFKERCLQGKPCPCRGLSPAQNMERWEGMLDGTYAQGEAVARVKTDLAHPNPAVRDWPALRIDEAPHPRTGTRFRVWPLYNWGSAIDDHELRISHILRGKEHEVNTLRQRYLYDHFGWDFPEVIHHGRIGIRDALLSKSEIKRGVEDGTYDGWDDPRLFTLAALRRRGIQPEAIRRMVIEVGIKPVDVTVSLKTLDAYNRFIVEPIANRYFFVSDPVRCEVRGLKRSYTSKLNLHPSHPERGVRVLRVREKGGAATLVVERRDARALRVGSIVRLMGLFNVRADRVAEDEIVVSFVSEPYEDAREWRVPLIHWLPFGVGIETSVLLPDGAVIRGVAEARCGELNVGEVVQFERFGFVRIDRVDRRVIACFAHK